MSLARPTDRAVSPVIAVILMVAIVVVLAAVVGAYTLQFGDENPEPAPNVRFDAVYDERTSPDGQYLNITIQGGETAPTENLEFVVDGAIDDDGDETSFPGDPLDQVGTELVTADTIDIDADSFSGTSPVDLSDATVTLVWVPGPDAGDPGQTQSIWTWEDE